MKILLRFTVFLATIVAVIALLIGGVFLGTGSLDYLENTGLIPDLGQFQSAPNSDVAEPEMTSETGGATVLSFTWQDDEIIHNGKVISETEFAELLDAAKANDTKVEIIQFSNVRVESADRRRQLLNDSEVWYEVIPQD